HPHDIYSPSEPWTIRIKQIGHEFVKAGHTVTLVYFPLDPQQIGKETDYNGVRVIALDRRVGLHRLFRNIGILAQLARTCNIVHFQKYHYYCSIPAMIAALICGTPIHYDWDDWETKIWYFSNPKNHFVGGFIDLFEKILPRIANTVSVSGRHVRQLCLHEGVKAENIFAAPVGANLEAFHPDSHMNGTIKTKFGIGHSLVLYLGQLHGGQYVELFIKAIPQVIVKRPDVTFMIVGDGYRRQELEMLARDLGVLQHLIFTGTVPHDDIPYYIGDADVCVACFEENDITRCKSPLKIAEYMASGKAVVASCVGEVRNMLGGLGILTEPGDPRSLAEGIVRLLADRALRERLRFKTRQRVEQRYNWRVTARNILNAYQCLSGRK
ncbi:MAG: glycosyltransferase family 4 protein, partial [Candidatus Omnitrophica bacterium]|nr:glycosyltransferase family 4 protein [Candidatus Omnitrophota bacterium]